MNCRNCGATAHEAHPDMCCICMGICFGPADHQAEHDEYELRDLESTQEQDSTPFADEEDDRAADSSVEWSERTADKWDFDSDPDWR